nr:kappa-type opioid receptor-like [Lytechinus pictus]
MLNLTSFHFDRPMVILPFINLSFSLLANAFLLFILHQQQKIDDTTRLTYRVSTVLQIILSVTWCSWDVLFYISDNVDFCETISNVFSFMTFTILFSQLFCYCFISGCKLLLITRPLRYHIFLTPLKVKLTVVLMVLLSTLCSIPLLPLPHIKLSYYAWYCYKTPPIDYASLFYFIDVFIHVILITVLVVSTLIHVIILRVICQHKHRLDVAARITEHTDGSPQIRVYRRWHFPAKGVVTVFILTISFYICWFPWVVTWGDDVGNMMAELNGWLQPLIYILTTKEAKEIVHHYILAIKMNILRL